MDLSSMMILDNKYILHCTIGSGGTSEVRLGECKDTNQRVAIKIMKNQKEIQSLAQEVSMLKRIKSPNIINILDGGNGSIVRHNICTDPKLYLVLELAEHGELFDYVFYPKLGFGEEKGRYLFKGIVDGLEACHEAGVVHRDIKMENIMVDSEWNVRIADFGFATLLEGKAKNGILTTPLGTLSYAPPEIIYKQPYNGASADIFSLGAVLIIIVLGRMGFTKAIKMDPFYKHIWTKEYDSYWSMINANNKLSISDEFKDLYTKIVAADPMERLTLKEIKAHPWMLGNIATKEEIKEDFEHRIKYVRKGHEIEIEKRNEPQQIKKGPFTVYRSPEENDRYQENMKCLLDEEFDLNHTKIILKGITPYVFMNQLVNYFEDNVKGIKEIESNNEKGELSITYEVDEIDEIDDCDIELEPLSICLALKTIKNKADSYSLILTKESGDKIKFYDVMGELIITLNNNNN